MYFRTGFSRLSPCHLIFPVDPAEAVEIGLAAETDLLTNVGLRSLALDVCIFGEVTGALLDPHPVLQPRSVASTKSSSLLLNFVHGDK